MDTTNITQGYVLYNGKRYIKEETETEVILTALDVIVGYKRSVLIFSKDIEESQQIETAVAKMIKKSIVTNYLSKSA